jgi:hypothetical protein
LACNFFRIDAIGLASTVYVPFVLEIGCGGHTGPK